MSTDRRALIVTGAVELIATRGIRALTHRALDAHLGLPPGSTSYYFRTRQALIEAVADGITSRSRADFAEMFAPDSLESLSGAEAVRRELASAIATWLDQLLARRRDELIARHALIIEVLSDPELHARLAGGLFSHDRATGLFTALGAPDPDAAAADFLALLEGLVFDRFAGARAGEPAGTADSVALLTRPLAKFLAVNGA
ncbi:TetR/AcrR family transcriptional regulator [Nocardia asteroides]|uniref:TetR/AcrR family transcriptional regulator n=1 Tax=Nocardia asteroides TaxID=1824 RepID=UPI001E2CFF87|nr:TetR family transcriptional regulator [Nocardia asteroides]UGT53042.1 TetR family transcriptional regulator [Nocardia asteroides]